jgi:hypothetical protein
VLFMHHDTNISQSAAQPEGTQKLSSSMTASYPWKSIHPLDFATRWILHDALYTRSWGGSTTSPHYSMVSSYFVRNPEKGITTLAEIWKIYRCLADDAVATRAALDRFFEYPNIYRATCLDSSARCWICLRLSEAFKPRFANVPVTGQ